MSEVRDGLLYTASHEWIRYEGEVVVVGITDFAQHQLTDVVFVEVPEVGREVRQGEACAVVESCKVAADVYAPMSGVIAEVNATLADAPEKVNQDPFGDGWFFKIKYLDQNEDTKLLGPAQYLETCKE